MTPAARHAAAIVVLDRIAAGAAAEQALSSWARGARYAGSGDRAALRDIVFDILRCRETCAAFGGGRDGRALVLGHLRRTGVAPDTIFTGEGHAPAPLSAAEAAACAPPGAVGPEVDIPEWLRMKIGPQYPDAEAIYEAFQARAPLWIRVNLRRATLPDAVASLARDGILAAPDPRADTALAVTEGGRRLRQSAVYSDGWVEPQDLSVQMAMARVPWPQTGRVLDYCAGGGGKALALADRTGAEITAHDALPGRMADLPTRAARAGARIGLAETAALGKDAPFDAVLCDVPCSGSGTWRRDPEAKWALTPERLADLTETQDAILDAAAPLVAPGGLLAYMTCSLLEEENGARIDAFLARGVAGLRLEDAETFTPLTASDGFFVAVLRAP